MFPGSLYVFKRPFPATIAVSIASCESSAMSAEFAFKFSAVCVAVETGLSASDVLSTFPRPTSPFTNPAGDVIVLFVKVCVPVVVTNRLVSAIPWIAVVSAWWLERFVATVVKKAGSSPIAAAISSRELRSPGAPAIVVARSTKYARFAQWFTPSPILNLFVSDS